MAFWPWHLPPSAIKANFVGLDKQEGPFLLLWPLQSIDLVHYIQNNTELNLHFTITFNSLKNALNYCAILRNASLRLEVIKSKWGFFCQTFSNFLLQCYLKKRSLESRSLVSNVIKYIS